MDGLSALWDGVGPCACGVKDSHRTKTSEATRRVLAIFWGCEELHERTESAAEWFCELLGPWTSTTGTVAWSKTPFNPAG